MRCRKPWPPIAKLPLVRVIAVTAAMSNAEPTGNDVTSNPPVSASGAAGDCPQLLHSDVIELPGFST
jgi:hypothetical protein